MRTTLKLSTVYEQFFVQKFERDSECTYIIRVAAPDDRSLRNVEDVVTASDDRMEPQQWVIGVYGEDTYT